jgi:hypothetical protein
MDLHLQTTTEQLRTTIADGLDFADASAGLHDAERDEIIGAVLDEIARLAIASIRPRTLERQVLAALDRADGRNLAAFVIHNRATGRQSTPAEQAATAEVLSSLHHIGYIERRPSHRIDADPALADDYVITDQGRSALRS